MSRYCSDREMLVSKETGILATCFGYTEYPACWWDEWQADWDPPPVCGLPEWRTWLEAIVCNRDAVDRTTWEVTPTGFCLAHPGPMTVILDSVYCGGQAIPEAMVSTAIPPGKGGWLFYQHRSRTGPTGPN